MSVINSMLRDLDRRHAPLPVKASVLPTLAQHNRVLPRSAVALCALIIVVMWSWNHHSKQTAGMNAPASVANAVSTLPAKMETEKPQKNTTDQVVNDISLSSQHIAEPTAAVNEEANRLAPQNISSKETHASEKQETKIAVAEKSKEKTDNQEPAPIIKQDRINPNALNDERYQLARAALAQNQPQRAYELLRDNPPPFANATDYHAVLAAVEQQLGHYADASLRYQQLLMLDQNQASWWLGFALSLEGEHRNRDALAAYQRAAQLNSLPDAARQYADSRIAALSVSAEH